MKGYDFRLVRLLCLTMRRHERSIGVISLVGDDVTILIREGHTRHVESSSGVLVGDMGA
jgi:ethanolamine utilization microcompartment shell protein EutL